MTGYPPARVRKLTRLAASDLVEFCSRFTVRIPIDRSVIPRAASIAGVCICHGYTGLPFQTEILIMAASLIVSLLLVSFEHPKEIQRSAHLSWLILARC